jgi:hypothetical protein
VVRVPEVEDFSLFQRVCSGSGTNPGSYSKENGALSPEVQRIDFTSFIKMCIYYKSIQKFEEEA